MSHRAAHAPADSSARVPSFGSSVLALVLVAAVVLIVGVPVAGVAGSIVRSVDRSGASELWAAAAISPAELGLYARTAGVAILIGILAAILATGPAWWLRDRTAARWPALILPMVLPNFLAYSAWGLVRAPGTALGDWLARGPGGDAVNWWPVAAGRVLAVLGLSLWAWPIAAVVLAAAFARVDRSVLESLRSEGAGGARRAWHVGRLNAGAIAASIGLVSIVMIGSAVPFHVSGLETAAIVAWRGLDERGADDQGLVWVSAWPLIVAAAGAALVIGRRVGGSGDAGPGSAVGPSRRRRMGPAALATALVFGASVVAPVVLLAQGLERSGAVAGFARMHRSEIASSLRAALGAAAVALAIGGAVWCALSCRGLPRAAGRLAWMALLAAGLVPGVLVGSALARSWADQRGLGWATSVVGESEWAVVWAHTVRFGCVGALAGLWMAGREPDEERWNREIDGASGVRGWAAACLCRGPWALACSALVVFALSMHEIESAIFVSPAGTGGLARVMLDLLHYNRTQDLIAGMLTIFAGGAAAAGAAAAAAWAWGRAAAGHVR